LIFFNSPLISPTNTELMCLGAFVKALNKHTCPKFNLSNFPSLSDIIP
jgi:hypothetical protein